MKKIGLKILLASLSITVLTAVMHLISGSLEAGNYYLWLWMANVLVTASLFPLIRKNALRGGALVFAVFVVYYIVGIFSLLIEAYIFNVTERSLTLMGMLWGIPLFYLSTWILVKVIGTEGNGRSLAIQDRGIGSWIVKVLSGNVLYFVFYFTAGLILQMSYPPLMDYYSDKIPSLQTIAATQLFLRGFLFVGVAIIIDRYAMLGNWEKALVTGAIFAIIGGIAPLLTPSELMPQGIRLAHGFEVGISNFLYGVVLYRIIRQKPTGQTQPTAGDAFQSNAVAS